MRNKYTSFLKPHKLTFYIFPYVLKSYYHIFKEEINIMNEKQREKIALFRYAIISPAVCGAYSDSQSLKGFFRDAATTVYTNPSGEDTKVSASTIERWFYAYKANGFDGLIPKRRTDKGLSRKLDDDIIEQIKFLKTEYPRIPATLIHQKLLENGSIRQGDISLSTITRFINQFKQELNINVTSDMRRYERAHINEVWCGDSSVGPYLTIDKSKKRTYIIALIDDASRMIVGIDIFFNDNFINLMTVMKSAVTKYGRPQLLNFDNGSTYKNSQINLLAARIGTTIHYNKPYSPIGKAKIERWFRTMKDQWMSTINTNDISTIDELRKSLFSYVSIYQKRAHSSLNDVSPLDRFFSESPLIKRLNDDLIEKSFLLEYERRVSADNVIVLNDIHYEVPYIYSKQKITIRYSPDLERVFVVDKVTNEYTPIKLLNKSENSYVKREKIKLSEGNENE